MELSKHLSKLTLAILLAVLPLQGADITPGYTFSSGEQGVTHTKLNNAAAGTINTTFYSGKSAITDPVTSGHMLILDSTSGEYRKWQLSSLLDWDEWISARTAETQPAGGDSLLVYDTSAAALRRMTLNELVWTNAAWFSAISNAHPASAEPLQLLTASNGVYYTLAASNLSAALDFTPLTSLTRATNGDLFLIQRGTTNYALASSNLFESAFLMHPLSGGALTNDTLLLLGTNGAVVRANLSQIEEKLTNSTIGTNRLAAEIRTNLTAGWAVYEAVGNAIVNQSGVFSGVTSNGLGSLTFTFASARSGSNYLVQLTPSFLDHTGTQDPMLVTLSSNTTSFVHVTARDSAGIARHPRRLYITIIGN